LKKYAFIFTLTILIGFVCKLKAQSYSFEIQLKNQPNNYIIIGAISGDDFQPLDTILLHRGRTAAIKAGEYTFPENSAPGMYRLIFGKTTYAKVMDEPPQQLDFIFNNEDIILETDFEAPEENLLVVLSEENRVWFEFLQREKIVQKKLDDFILEIEFFRKKDNPAEEELQNTIIQYNELQKQRDDFITELISRYPDKFAAKLIEMHREPFLDGNLTKKERRQKFQSEFFNQIDISDESLIHSAIYTDKVFFYLTSYNRPDYTREQLEKEYMKAVDIVLANSNENQKVYEFILEYIFHGFEVLQMENVLNYIADNYSGTTCQADENTTLKRKLAALKMKSGATVPDFTLFDSEGFFVDFADVQHEKTLILFWASWCPHCSEIIPHIKNWASQQDNLSVVAISLDSSKLEWQNAIEKLGIENWTNLSDLKKWEGEVVTKYNVYATPTMFVIDKERKILAKPLTVQDLLNLDLE
jgi:thiol-disulfide isomerase/thioredoxin